MGVQVAFDQTSWNARYPEFAGVDPNFVEECFNEATIYHRNDGGGPVSSATIQSTLLNMLTAHIVQLNAAQNGQPAAQTVGRISTAAEGSVSVVLENKYPEGTPQWFQQTKYGSAYWMATNQYRRMRYTVGRQRIFNPWPFQ